MSDPRAHARPCDDSGRVWSGRIVEIPPEMEPILQDIVQQLVQLRVGMTALSIHADDGQLILLREMDNALTATLRRADAALSSSLGSVFPRGEDNEGTPR